MNLRDLDLRILPQPGPQAPPAERRRPPALVTYESSPYLTPEHVDVTSSPAAYARAKTFSFPSKRQLRVMDADRWIRQRMKAANRVAVSELPPVHFSLDRLDALHVPQLVNRSAVEFIGHAVLNASRRLLFTEKTVR